MITLETARQALHDSNSRLRRYKPVYISAAPDAIARKAGFSDWIQYDYTGRITVNFLNSRENDPVTRERLEQFTAEHHPQDLNRQMEEYIYIHSVMKLLFADLRGLSILQLASNYGPFLHFLKHEEKARVAGIDLNRWAVDYASENGLDVRFGNAETMPFADAQFDVVLSKNFLCPIYVGQFKIDLPKVLAETYRVLKPGGLFISQLEEFICPDYEGGFPFRMIRRLPREIEAVSTMLSTIRYFEKPADQP